MKLEHVDGFMCGVLVMALAFLIAAQCIEGSWEKCERQGWFSIDNQKYECKPTGQWVDE